MGKHETGKRGGTATPRAPQTFHYRNHIRDSIAVQRKHKKTNDDEEHEENPNLQDLLVPHHSVDIQPEAPVLRRPTLSRPSKGILHNADCPSRHSCEITESKRRISFGHVVVRDYDMVLGDHPNCSYGPPVSLGWHYLEYEPLPVNEYEYHHSRRRPLKRLMLNYYRRKDILVVENSNDELKKATKEVGRVKMQRAVTKTFLPLWKVGDVFESGGRKLKRIVKKDRPEKNDIWWEPEDELDWSRHSTTPSILKL